MAKVTSEILLNTGIRVSSSIFKDINNRIDTSKYPQFRHDEIVKYPVQMLCDKVQRVEGKFTYRVGFVPGTTDIQIDYTAGNKQASCIIGYDKICATMHWKSFKFTDDGQHVTYKKLTD